MAISFGLCVVSLFLLLQLAHANFFLLVDRGRGAIQAPQTFTSRCHSTRDEQVMSDLFSRINHFLLAIYIQYSNWVQDLLQK